MLVISSNGYQRKYVYGGSGILDSIISAFTNDIAKQVAIDVGKKATTEVGNRIATKAIDKIIPKKKGNGVQDIIAKYKKQPIDLVSYVKGNGLKRI